MTIDTVYLVEDNTLGGDGPARDGYWARVYVSEAKAKAGVEHAARSSGVGELHWENATYLWIAYPAGITEWAYKIIPLGVHADDQPEPHYAPR